MANVDASFGLIPTNLDGARGSAISANKYIIPAAEGTDLFVGDPVLITGTAILDLVDGCVYPTVARAGTSGYITGVIVGFVPETDESLRYKTDATTQRTVLVADDPDQVFEIQADGSVALTDIGNTADLIFTNAGSTVLGRAGAELDTADIGTGNQLVIIGVSRNGTRNDLSSANPVLRVKINLHTKRNTTGV